MHGEFGASSAVFSPETGQYLGEWATASQRGVVAWTLDPAQGTVSVVFFIAIQLVSGVRVLRCLVVSSIRLALMMAWHDLQGLHLWCVGRLSVGLSTASLERSKIGVIVWPGGFQ